MDQSAFRSLLSSSSSTSTPSSSASSSRPKFGAPPPKPSTSSSSSGKPTDFKPRPPSSKKKEFKKKPSTEGEGAYRDRAAERRAGKAGDFGEAEKLLEEFEERGKQGDEEDRIKREEQRKYLGGDATHSILVKGLDMALLNQEKAKLSMKAEGELEDVEQQLDEQFEKPVSSKKGQGKGKGKEKEIGKGKGKTRDELLMEFKASREGGDQAKNVAGLGKGWKKLGAPEMAVTKGKGFAPVGGGEKKLRKKKKKVVDPSTPATPTASTSAPPSITSVPPASASTEMKKEDLATMNPDEEDDDDIFCDVGDYKGLESDSDSSSDEKKPRIKKESSLPAPALPPSHSNSTKRKYFDDEEAEDESISTAPSAVADLASRQALHSATQPQPKRRVKREDSFGSQSGSESDSEAGATTGKLQPLSGSGPNVSELLKFDKLAQEEEERKAKKQKRKQEKEEKELSRADKDNRDYLQMEAYLEKKKNGGVTPERKQSDERDMREKEGMYADI